MGRGWRRKSSQECGGTGCAAPDVILANGAAGLAPLLDVSRTAPIVFVLVADPVGAGFVNSLARPAAIQSNGRALRPAYKPSQRSPHLLECVQAFPMSGNVKVPVRDCAIHNPSEEPSADILPFCILSSAAVQCHS
jgi:hypothetical protein